jgi:MFS family permease
LRWHVLLATWLGMLFDGLDASIYVLTLYPCLCELLHTTSHAAVAGVGALVMAIFMFGWTAGAIVFGTVADYIGRTQTLIITVILYAVATGLCAFSHNWQELALYRFFVGCGIGGEISIGGVMLSEYWRGNARLHATGVLQSAFSCGFLLLAGINLLVGDMGWRPLYLIGTGPALLAVYIRLRLKEPEDVLQVQAQRTRLRQIPPAELTSSERQFLRFTLPELFRQHAGKLTILVLLASTVCIGNFAITAWIPSWINQLTGTEAVRERSFAAMSQNFGAIAGAITGGAVVLKLGRAWSFRLAFAGSFLSCVAMFLTTSIFDFRLIMWSFIVGFFVMAPYTYLFIYVPELFETRLRATAFGFSIQMGRIFAGLAAILAGKLIAALDGSYARAGAIVSLFFLVGIAASFFMPKSTGVVSEQTAGSDAN